MRMLDDLTPYYQARMQWLSPQQRKIIEFLCDRRHPVPVKEIAQRCFMTHQTASGQLKDLREKGYVTSEAIGRESFYELREPLMRFCLEVKKQRGELIRLYVDFLRLWYTQPELQQLLQLLPDDALEREYLLKAIQAAEEKGEDPRVIACLKESKDYIEKNDFVPALKIAEKLVAIRGDARDWAIQGYCLGILKRYDEALASCDKEIELNPNSIPGWDKRSIVLGRLGRYDEALTSWDKVIELDPNYVRAWDNRGYVLYHLRRYDEALVCCHKAIELGIELDEQSSFVFLNKAETLLALNRWDEGTAALEDAIDRFAYEAENNLLISIDADKQLEITTGAIVCHLLNSTHDAAIWRSRITTLITLYDKHQVISALGQGLVGSIPALMSDMVSDKAARTWLEVWRELVSDRPEFQIPLRLLNTAVRYRETKGDKRVLLELPIEERKLLKPLLGIEKP
jgi:tetratricopeptide (TPR) repeat protein